MNAPEPRAKFHVKKFLRGKVFIIDLDQSVSVTNDAEAVCRWLHERCQGRRIIYRDTEGRWDELKHTLGVFTGFAPYNEYLPKELQQ